MENAERIMEIIEMAAIIAAALIAISYRPTKKPRR